MAVSQNVFKLAVFSLLPIVAWLWRHGAAVSAELAANAPPGFRVPQIGDLWIGACAMVAICAMRVVFVAVMKPAGRAILSERKRTQPARVERWATCLFKFSYFAIITSVGVALMSGEDWFPAVLGGSGATANCYKGYPYQTLTPALQTYYLVQLGYHLHSLVFLVVLSHRNDFLEMLLHHVAAVLAIVASYCTSYAHIGCLVLMVHDIGDVTGYAIKAAVDTPYTGFTLSLYALLLASWGYTRLYAFPFHILNSILFEAPELVPQHAAFQRGVAMLMICLQCLHVWWYCLFIKMGMAFMQSGKTDDTQDYIAPEPEDKKRS